MNNAKLIGNFSLPNLKRVTTATTEKIWNTLEILAGGAFT